MSVSISKDTIHRLLKDVKHIMKNPLTENGIYYIHDDTDMLKGYALIIGPSDTPYFGGNYFFELIYPTDYPHSPPKVTYCTNGNNIRFNPNLYTCGKVCISLLNTWRGEQWTSCQSISTILLTLCTILCEDPLLNEPGVTKGHVDCNNYNTSIQFANIDIAICDIVDKKQSVFMPFFDNFYPFIKENFIKNYDKIVQTIEETNTKLNNNPTVYKTRFYNMTVNVDYNLVLEKIKASRANIET